MRNVFRSTGAIGDIAKSVWFASRGCADETVSIKSSQNLDCQRRLPAGCVAISNRRSQPVRRTRAESKPSKSACAEAARANRRRSNVIL
jgi:hypothetical protein